MNQEVVDLLALCFYGYEDLGHVHSVRQYDGEQLVGYAGLVIREMNGVRLGGISQVCVHPDYRSRGRGMGLVDDSVFWLADQGCDFVVLFTNLTGYYERLGFTAVANLSGNDLFAYVLPLGERDWHDSYLLAHEAYHW